MSPEARNGESVTAARFRELLGHLAGGVAVVTTVAGDGTPRGLTATSVCSVSLIPPLVLACLGADAKTREAIRETGTYALNFLHSAGRTLADRFASSAPDKFEDLQWATGPGGSPLLDPILAWVECEVEREIEAGDHAIFIARVRAGGLEHPGGDPLLHFRGRYYPSLGVGA